MSSGYGIVNNREKLCPGCKSLPPVDQLLDHHHRLHDRHDEFMICQCPFCHWLSNFITKDRLKTIEDHNRQATVELVAQHPVRENWSMWLILEFDIPIGGTRSVTSERTTVFDLFATPTDHIFDVIRRHDPALDPWSPEAFETIQIWLNVCTSEHARCRQQSRDSAFPTYLVDVGLESSHQVHLRRNTESNKDPYIALSYVWGVEQQRIELRKQTEGAMLAGIPDRDIPQTILDAIRTTRRLKIRYLWVDSLCIVQDDKVMKTEEIVKMSGIFQGSYLTIQAASAKTVNEGFLKIRAPDNLPEYQLLYSQSSGEHILLRPRMNTLDTIQASTGCRAWCFEESVLSRRLLVFGQDQLSYKCRMADQCENGQLSEGRDLAGPGFWMSLTTSAEGLKPPYNGDRRLLILRLWHGVLSSHYTPRLLTKPHDRLPAINGLARALQKDIGGRYVAGLWESDLLFGLLWRTSDRLLPHWDVALIDRIRDRRKSGYNYLHTDQPSWSWAAVDGPILQFGRRFFIDVVASASIPESSLRDSDDPFGAIDGRLSMTAPLQIATLTPYFGPSGGSSNRRGVLYHPGGSDPGADHSKIFGEAYLDTWGNFPQTVWIALVIEKQGLVLDCVSEDQKIYRRIGLFVNNSYFPEGRTKAKFVEQGKIQFEII